MDVTEEFMSTHRLWMLANQQAAEQRCIREEQEARERREREDGRAEMFNNAIMIALNI